jgi:hypothetical protein
MTLRLVDRLFRARRRHRPHQPSAELGDILEPSIAARTCGGASGPRLFAGEGRGALLDDLGPFDLVVTSY